MRVILRSLYSFMMNSVAWPEGSMISGYLGVRQHESMFREPRQRPGEGRPHHSSAVSRVSQEDWMVDGKAIFLKHLCKELTRSQTPWSRAEKV